jgi:alpha-N-arabinofuranosidase
LQEKVIVMSTLSAQLYLDTKRTIGEISPLIFGGFAEHMGRSIYERIYDPQSPHADERGLRRDVMAALRELDLRIIRYPGGNFLSGYHWLDGVGSREKRPTRRDLACTPSRPTSSARTSSWGSATRWARSPCWL